MWAREDCQSPEQALKAPAVINSGYVIRVLAIPTFVIQVVLGLRFSREQCASSKAYRKRAKVNSLYRENPRDRELVSLTARVRNSGNLYI